MKHQTASSPARAQRKRTPSAPEIKGARIIQCGHCQNTFSAVPRAAVCRKCGRPANKPLSRLDISLCLTLFPAGLLKALLMRPSRPYAAAQALGISLSGAAVWGAVYLLFLQR